MSYARPRRRNPGWSWLLGMVLQATALSVQAIDARVRAGLEVDGDAWIGQQVVLKIDLLTSGLSFSGQRIHLPDVPGALVLEDIVATVKLNERVDGETWQVLSYRYPMFPQRAGRIEIGAVAVAFAVSEGYGSEPVAFDLQTEALSLWLRRPPGVTDPARLITTTDFSLEVAVTPDPVDLQVGDALTRTVTRTAAAVSGMAFAPLPTPEIPGMAVYPGTPGVNDSNNRGNLTGTRVESVTYVLQQAGELTIPEIKLQWWHPVAEKLHTETVPALTFEVAVNPDLAPGLDPLENTLRLAADHPWAVLAALVGMAAALGAALRWLPSALRRWRRRRTVRRHSEAARFKQLLRACRSNDPARSYNAYVKWASGEDSLAPALLCETDLARELERLQTALVQRQPGWRGGSLAGAVQRVRRLARRTRRETAARVLPALNP